MTYMEETRNNKNCLSVRSVFVILIMTSLLFMTIMFPNARVSPALTMGAEKQASINQSTYDLYLNTTNNNITRGENLIISLGVVNKTGDTEVFVSDVKVTLRLFNQTNDLVYSENYNTTDSLLNVTISFKYLLTPSEYLVTADTIDFNPYLSKSIPVNVYIGTAPRLSMFLPSEPVAVNVQQEYSLNGEILNTGGSTAFNISISITVTDNYPLSDIRSSLPYFIKRLNSNSRYAFTINVSLSDFGRIELSLNIQYNDDSNKQFINAFPLTFYAFPQLIYNVKIPTKEIVQENISSFDLTIHNQENEDIHLEVRVISEDVEVVIQAFLVNLNAKSSTTLRITFLPHQTGLAKIMIYLDFIEANGDIIPNAYQLAPIYFNVTPFIQNTRPQGTSQGNPWIIDLRVWALTFFLSGLGLFFIVIILYMFRFHIYLFIQSFFARFKYKTAYSIGEREFEYESDIVIVDGSNVAWDETDQGKARLENIKTAIEVLKAKGFKEIIIVIDAALRYQIDDRKGLDKLIREGIIKPLPARVKADQFILRLAEEKNAMILSNDLYREYRDDVPWIDERRIPFTILNKELYLHPTLKRSLKLQNEELMRFKDPSNPVIAREHQEQTGK